MRKIFVILAGILLLAAGCQKQSGQNEVLAEITITSPVSGQKLEIDSEYEISWTRNDVSGGLLSIDLISTDGANRMYKITYAAPKENKRLGKLKWKVSGIETGRYKIHIYAPVSCSLGELFCKPNGGYSGEIIIGNQNVQNFTQGEKEGWQTYANSRYGFEIKYPKDFELFLDVNEVKSLSYIPLCDPDMVACIFYSKGNQKNSNFEGAGVSLNLLANLNSQAKCGTMEGTKGAETIINGEIFLRFGNGGAAAGHFEEFQANRIFRNNICFEARLRMTSANVDNYPEESKIREFNSKEVWARLEQVLGTFKFVGFTPSEADANGFKTFKNFKYGFELNVPASWRPSEKNNAIILDDSHAIEIYNEKEFFADQYNRAEFGAIYSIVNNYGAFKNTSENGSGGTGGTPFHKSVLKTKIGGVSAIDLREESYDYSGRYVGFLWEGNFIILHSSKSHFDFSRSAGGLLDPSQADPDFVKIIAGFRLSG